MAAPIYLTADQLSERWDWHISPDTLANWRTKKKGPPYIKLGGRVLYPLHLVEQWEAANTVHDNDNEEPNNG